MVIQYLPIAMIGLALVQSILLLCIFVQVRSINKQQPKREPREQRSEKPVAVQTTVTASPILPWLRNNTRDDMIESFRVLARAQQNERK